MTLEAWMDPEKVEEVLRRYDADESLRTIAKAVGVSHERVRQVAMANGRKARGPNRVPDGSRHSAVEEFISSDETVETIAARYGVVPRTVRDWARKAGVPDRRLKKEIVAS